MKIALGKFARSSIEELFGADLHAGVQAALTHYTRRLSSNLKPIRPPDFSWVSVDGADSFDLTLAPELEAALESEALEQRVPLDQILVHAVLVYLADLESVSFSGDVATPGTAAGPFDGASNSFEGRLESRSMTFGPSVGLVSYETHNRVEG